MSALGPPPARKLRVATASLAGCFGCHMSLLDIDERIIELLRHVELDRSPLTDQKHAGPCDVGLLEGGVCNAENVHVLREFRARCKVLVSVGACAITGGLPAQRNALDVREVLSSVYLTGPGVVLPKIPSDPELPLLLSKVHPLHDVVAIDYFVPGCPPSAETLWRFLADLLAGRTPQTRHGLIHYD